MRLFFEGALPAALFYFIVRYLYVTRPWENRKGGGK